MPFTWTLVPPKLVRMANNFPLVRSSQLQALAFPDCIYVSELQESRRVFVPFVTSKAFSSQVTGLSFLRSEQVVPPVSAWAWAWHICLFKLTWFEFQSFQQLMALSDWELSGV